MEIDNPNAIFPIIIKDILSKAFYLFKDLFDAFIGTKKDERSR